MDLGSSWDIQHGVYKKAEPRKDVGYQLVFHTGGGKEIQFDWGLTCQNLLMPVDLF